MVCHPSKVNHHAQEVAKAMGHCKLAQASKIHGRIQKTEPGSYKDRTDRLTQQIGVSEQEIIFEIVLKRDEAKRDRVSPLSLYRRNILKLGMCERSKFTQRMLSHRTCVPAERHQRKVVRVKRVSDVEMVREPRPSKIFLMPCRPLKVGLRLCS